MVFFMCIDLGFIVFKRFIIFNGDMLTIGKSQGNLIDIKTYNNDRF